MASTRIQENQKIPRAQLEETTARYNIQWQPFPDFEHYKIADHDVDIKIKGKVIPLSVIKDEGGESVTLVSMREDKYGYTCFTLHFKSELKRKRRTYPLHQARLKIFGGAPPGSGMEVRHLDGNKSNNHIKNLEWGTHKDNMRDLSRHGTLKGENNPSAVMVSEEAVTVYVLARLGVIPIKELSAITGFTVSHIHGIRNEKAWKHALTPNIKKWVSQVQTYNQLRLQQEKVAKKPGKVVAISRKKISKIRQLFKKILSELIAILKVKEDL